MTDRAPRLRRGEVLGSETPARESHRPPRSKRLPLIGALPFIARDPVGFCTQAALAGGGIARLDVGPVKAYVVSHPDHVHQVLVTNAGNYCKGRMMDGARSIVGNGLITSDGALWRRQRRLAQPAFHARQVERMAQVVVEEVAGQIVRWAPAIAQGVPVDMLDETIQLNVRTVLRTLFGDAIDAVSAAALAHSSDAVIQEMRRRMWVLIKPPWLPMPGAAAYRRAIRTLDEHIYRIVDARLAGREQDDLLGALLSARDPDTGEGMSRQQVRDEILTLFLAGFESTGTTVAWTWYLLATHPDADRRLRAELDAVLGDRAPTYADLPALCYTQMVVSESLRLFPPLPMNFRTSIGHDTLGPLSIPPGAGIVICPYATHRDPRWWDDPETFEPERFRPERLRAQHRHAFYPFSYGQRICMGQAMALATAQLIVATLAHRFDTKLPAGAVVEGRYVMAYQPKNGLPLLLRPRGRVA